MEKLKDFFYKIGRWVIIAICAVLILCFDKVFPNVSGDQKNLISLAIAIPLILCVLTIDPKTLAKNKNK